MRKILLAAPLMLTSLLALPAMADSTYLVSKVTIKGSKSVPTADLMAVVKEHKGQRVTTADIQADLTAIEHVLENAHVQGRVDASAATTGNTTEIIFTIADEGIVQPTTKTVSVKPKLDQQIFTGNVAATSDALSAADGLTKDEDLDAATIKTAAQAILDYYKKNAPHTGVAIGTSSKQTDDTHINLIWQITETTAKAGDKKSDDSSSQQQSQ